MNKFCILVLAAISSFSVSQAQKTKKDTIIHRDMVLEKEYQPEVVSSERIALFPELEKNISTKREPAFSLSGNPISLKGEYIPLPAPLIKSEYPYQNQLGYLSVGAGSKFSFFADGQLNLISSPMQALDVRFMHRSIFGDITNSMNVASRAYANNNRLIATYRLHLPGNELTVSLSDKYNAWNYYGTWQTPINTLSESLPAIPDGQWLSDTKIFSNLKSKALDQALTWDISAEGHLFRLGKGVFAPGSDRETRGAFEKEFRVFGNLNLKVTDNLSIGTDGQLLQLNCSTPSSFSLDAYSNYFKSQSWIVVNPYARLTVNRWDLKVGIKATVPSLESERVMYNLTVSASTSLNAKTAFRASLGGGLMPFTYREGFELNPYLDPSIHLKPVQKPLIISAALDFRPMTSLRVSPVFEYERANNMPFFYNGYPSPSEYINKTYGHLFSAKYMNSNRFSIGADAFYNYQNKLTIFGKVRFNQYLNYSKDGAVDAQLKANGRRAWHMPGAEMQLRIDYSPVEKVSLFAGYELTALRYAPTSESFSSRLDDIHDVNIGVSWNMAKDVNVFIKLNNMLDQRYDIWNAYRVHGFTAMIGGSVRF